MPKSRMRLVRLLRKLSIKVRDDLWEHFVLHATE
jgi:hypothetical protein